MKQYQVPQFITVEDKVIGPLTIKQFLYVGGGAILIFCARLFLAPFLFFPIAFVVGAAAAALAFLKINEQPFPVIVKNVILYTLHPRLYTWQKQPPPKPPAQKQKAVSPESNIKILPKLSESKLSDLSWSLDIKEKTR